MRERIEALGGRLQIDSRKGEGTRLEIRVPLANNAADLTIECRHDPCCWRKTRRWCAAR